MAHGGGADAIRPLDFSRCWLGHGASLAQISTFTTSSGLVTSTRQRLGKLANGMAFSRWAISRSSGEARRQSSGAEPLQATHALALYTSIMRTGPGQGPRAPKFGQLAAVAAIAYQIIMTGAEMRELRKKLGWSQQRLATELGMSVSQIANYERGTVRSTGRQVAIPKVVELALEALEARHARGEI
jgi:hypothetical protein